VVRPGLEPRLLDLGPAEAIKQSIANYRVFLAEARAASRDGREAGAAVRKLIFDRLRLALAGCRVLFVAPDGALVVTGADAPQVGQAAAETGTVLHELTPQRASLEEAFMDLTRDSVDYHAEQSTSGAGPTVDGVPTYEGA
jgi:hypothetical protein